MEVRVVHEITQVESFRTRFRMKGLTEKEKIGKAVHERFIINEAKFNQRVEGKKS